MSRTKPEQHSLFILAAVSALALSLHSTRATGFDLPDQDPFAIARGMAFVATADNPSAIYYNPAGISQLEGNNVRAGVYGLYLDVSYQSPGGREFDNERDLHAIPQLFYTYTPKNQPVSFGLGLYAPFGLSSKWPQDTGFRTVATEGKLTYYTINPVVALKLSESLSLGAGLSANYAEADLQQGLFWPAQPYDLFKFKGDGWDVGYNLGLLWKIHEKVSIGATFRSGTRVKLEGDTTFYNNVVLPLPQGGAIPAFPGQSRQADAGFPFPLKTIVGISYRPTPDWNFEFNADYTDWSALGTVMVNQSSGFFPFLPKDVPLNLNWESSWYYEFGGTRYLGNGWSVSAGYIFNENSVPESSFTPLVSDLDRHFWSIGTGYKGEHVNFDIAYQFGYGPTRTVTGSPYSATGQTADGKYDFISHAVVMAVGYQF